MYRLKAKCKRLEIRFLATKTTKIFLLFKVTITLRNFIKQWLQKKQLTFPECPETILTVDLLVQSIYHNVPGVVPTIPMSKVSSNAPDII